MPTRKKSFTTAQPLRIDKTKISRLPEPTNKKANLAVGLVFEATNSLSSILSLKRARKQSYILPKKNVN
jgi:hypothetical protein